MRDLRVNAHRLFLTLLLLAEDDSNAKAIALKQAFTFTPRLAMQCLEWRAELLTARLAERAVSEGLIPLQTANSFIAERAQGDAADVVAVYQKLEHGDVPGSLQRLSQLDIKL
jgi:hypothetical protein